MNKKLLIAVAGFAATSFTHAADGVWTNTAGGSWATGTNWSGTTIADGIDAVANFATINIPTGTVEAGTVVTLDGARTVGSLNFGDTVGNNIWSLNAGTGGALTLSSTSGNSTLTASTRVNLGVGLAGNDNITFTGAGADFRLAGGNTYTGKTTVSGGATVNLASGVTFGANPVAFVADKITLNNGSLNILSPTSGGSARTIGANFGITLGSLGGTFTSFVVNSVISGTGPLTATNGTLTLNGANTYTGKTTIVTGGNISVANIGNSGATSALGTNGVIDITNFSNTSLIYTGTGETTDKVLNYNSASGGGRLTNNGTGVLTFSNAFTVQNNSSDFAVYFGGTGTTRIAGLDRTGLAATRDINFSKNDAGTLILTGTYDLGSGTLNGNLNINQGVVQVASTGNFVNIHTLTMGSGVNSGKFILGDAAGAKSTSVTGLTLSGTGTGNAIVGGNASVSTLTVNNSAAFTYAGRLGGAGANENNLGLVKSGAGELILSGNNTYTGATTVGTGTLTVSGAIGVNGVNGITIASGATLAVNGTLNLTSATDVVSNAGTLAFAASGSSILVGNVLDGISGNTYLLISGGTVTNAGNTIVSLLGSSTWSSATLDGSGYLTFTAVPEPSTYGLIGAGSLAAAALVCRRRKASLKAE